MAERLLYRNLARYYDLIYSFKDYQTEARRIIEVVEASKKSDGHDL